MSDLEMPGRRETAEELLKRLESDPEWVARRDKAEAVRAQETARLRAAEAPLLSELRSVGVVVTSVWDLVNTVKPYAEAIPVLVAHLSKPYPDSVSAGIARALAVSNACPHWAAMVHEYETTDARALPLKKEGLACALGVAACVLDDVIRMIADPSNGSSRLLLLVALKRSREPKAVSTVAVLAKDPVFSKEIASWRRRHR